MNAVILTVVVFFSDPMYTGDTYVAGYVEYAKPYVDMESCIEAATNVIGRDELIAVDCSWSEIEGKMWRINFGDLI